MYLAYIPDSDNSKCLMNFNTQLGREYTDSCQDVLCSRNPEGTELGARSQMNTIYFPGTFLRVHYIDKSKPRAWFLTWFTVIGGVPAPLGLSPPYCLGADLGWQKTEKEQRQGSGVGQLKYQVYLICLRTIGQDNGQLIWRLKNRIRLWFIQLNHGSQHPGLHKSTHKNTEDFRKDIVIVIFV